MDNEEKKVKTEGIVSSGVAPMTGIESYAANKKQDYTHIPRAVLLNNGKKILFADPARSSPKVGTYWITGKAYSDQYQEQNGVIPTVQHMDGIRSIIRSPDGNYFPKATLEYNCHARQNTPRNRVHIERRNIASYILQSNGLSGETYSGMVKQENGKYDVPVSRRMIETATGRRPRQREFKNVEHAGYENENVLLIKPDGTFHSFDISDDKQANLPVKKLEEELGGMLCLKSQRSNGYHSIDYLNARDGQDGAQKRFNSQLNRDANQNLSLPQVGIIIGDKFFDAQAVIRNKSAFPELVDSIVSGEKKYAHLVRIRSRTGGYWTPEYLNRRDPQQLSAVMQSNGISPKIGLHQYTAQESKILRMQVPTALVDTGNGCLESAQSVLSKLEPGETIARRYGPEKILVTNRQADNQPTGFYRQLGEAAKELHKVHVPSLQIIHQTSGGAYEPLLADPQYSMEGQKQLRQSARHNRGDAQYETRSRNRDLAARQM